MNKKDRMVLNLLINNLKHLYNKQNFNNNFKNMLNIHNQIHLLINSLILIYHIMLHYILNSECQSVYLHRLLLIKWIQSKNLLIKYLAVPLVGLIWIITTKSKREVFDVLFVDNKICLEIMSLMQKTYNYVNLLIMCLVDKSTFFVL